MAWGKNESKYANTAVSPYCWIEVHVEMLQRLDALRPGASEARIYAKEFYCKEYLVPDNVPLYRSPWLPSGASWKRGIWA